MATILRSTSSGSGPPITTAIQPPKIWRSDHRRERQDADRRLIREQRRQGGSPAPPDPVPRTVSLDSRLFQAWLNLQSHGATRSSDGVPGTHSRSIHVVRKPTTISETACGRAQRCPGLAHSGRCRYYSVQRLFSWPHQRVFPSQVIAILEKILVTGHLHPDPRMIYRSDSGRIRCRRYRTKSS